MNEASALFSDDLSRVTYNISPSFDYGVFRKMRRMRLINIDDWPDVILLSNKQLTISWLEQNTAISDVDLYSSDEAELFKSLEKMNTQLEKSVSAGVKALSSEIDKRRVEPIIRGQSSPRPNTAPQSDTTFNLSEFSEEELRDLYFVLAPVLREARAANQSISELREQLPKAKKRVLETADRRILLT